MRKRSGRMHPARFKKPGEGTKSWTTRSRNWPTILSYREAMLRKLLAAVLWRRACGEGLHPASGQRHRPDGDGCASRARVGFRATVQDHGVVPSPLPDIGDKWPVYCCSRLLQRRGIGGKRNSGNPPGRESAFVADHAALTTLWLIPRMANARELLMIERKGRSAGCLLETEVDGEHFSFEALPVEASPALVLPAASQAASKLPGKAKRGLRQSPRP